MEREIIAKEILKTVYLTLHYTGYSTVSLKKEDLLRYVPNIEKCLEKYNLVISDLFVKTPVEETYDEYKKFLIWSLSEFGSFNESYDGINLCCSDYYLFKCQRQLKEYMNVILECCYIISGDKRFIDGNNEIGIMDIKNSSKVFCIEK